jgi:vacuolar-type H+-ATPase subunit I/STV1
MEWLNQNAALVIGIILALINIGGWVWTKFNQAYKIKRDYENFHDVVNNHSKQISDMDTRHKEDYTKLDEKLDTISTTLTVFIQETKKDNQVILREKINYFYKLTLQKGYILEKDSKDYHYALDRYKANDGNSYILDEVEPRMKEFKVFLSDEDAEEYFKKSR